jgi:CHAT domain-containing protein
VQFYRLLDQGLSKSLALQTTRQMFSSGMIRLEGDVVIGAAGQPLLNELNPSQRRRIEAGVQNPFFWAGIELIGSPW